MYYYVNNKLRYIGDDTILESVEIEDDDIVG